jgi:DNA gyrase subunit B
LVKGEATDKTGTVLTFWADGGIFETTHYDFETLTRRFQEMAFLNRGLGITITDDRAITAVLDDEEPARRSVSYRYEGGITDFVKHLNASKGAAHHSIIDLASEDVERLLSVEISMQWNTGFAESVYTFANTINTTEGGTHEEGFRAALTTLVNKFAREWGILKEKDVNLSGEDVREGLTAIVSVKLGEPQFEGQTKTKLGNTEMKAYVQKAVNDQLSAWFEKNPGEGKEIARKSVFAATARLAARKARDLARNRKGLLGGAGMPGKLIDCSSREPEECEVFIVEGDSAGGSARQGRDPRTQAILPIRGKILNVASASADKIRGNLEIADLALALGCGMRKDCDPQALRYDRIIIMTDADVDGAHIATLLMTFFFQEMAEIVRKGHLYLAQPPLYRLTSGSSSAYARDDAHRAELEASTFKGKKVEVARFKGLGEMNPLQLRETTMSPATRGLIRITLPPEFEQRAAVKDLVDRLMGRNPEHRFNFIQNRASELDPDLIDA